jgi:hypothetical protein
MVTCLRFTRETHLMQMRPPRAMFVPIGAGLLVAVPILGFF